MLADMMLSLNPTEKLLCSNISLDRSVEEAEKGFKGEKLFMCVFFSMSINCIYVAGKISSQVESVSNVG